jgi:hypothetical protein
MSDPARPLKVYICHVLPAGDAALKIILFPNKFISPERLYANS